MDVFNSFHHTIIDLTTTVTGASFNDRGSQENHIAQLCAPQQGKPQSFLQVKTMDAPKVNVRPQITVTNSLWYLIRPYHESDWSPLGLTGPSGLIVTRSEETL